jgi:hypothetical protein
MSDGMDNRMDTGDVYGINDGIMNSTVMAVSRRMTEKISVWTKMSVKCKVEKQIDNNCPKCKSRKTMRQ